MSFMMQSAGFGAIFQRLFGQRGAGFSDRWRTMLTRYRPGGSSRDAGGPWAPPVTSVPPGLTGPSFTGRGPGLIGRGPGGPTLGPGVTSLGGTRTLLGR